AGGSGHFGTELIGIRGTGNSNNQILVGNPLVQTATSSNTVRLNRQDINDPPLGATNQKTIAENTLGGSGLPHARSYGFQSTSDAVNDFGFQDLVDSPANTFNGVFVTRLPLKGTLVDNGHTLVSADMAGSGYFVSKADLIGNKFSYTAGFGTPIADNYADFG